MSQLNEWKMSCQVAKVMQRDRFGCGVACAAMVAGRPYSDVRRVFADCSLEKKKSPFATNFSELRHCLERLGIRSELRRWSSWDAVDGLGIIAVSTSAGGRNWHWVVAERHEVFGVVLHDPDYDLPSFSGKAPEGVHHHPFTEYQPRKSWIKVLGKESAC